MIDELHAGEILSEPSTWFSRCDRRSAPFRCQTSADAITILESFKNTIAGCRREEMASASNSASKSCPASRPPKADEWAGADLAPSRTAHTK